MTRVHLLTQPQGKQTCRSNRKLGNFIAKFDEGALTRELRLEYVGDLIRVTQIDLGRVETEFSLNHFWQPHCFSTGPHCEEVDFLNDVRFDFGV